MKLVIEIEQQANGEWVCRSVRAGSGAAATSTAATAASRPGTAARNAGTGRSGNQPATEKQLAFLRHLRYEKKVPQFDAATLTRREAARMISTALGKSSNAA